MSGSSESTKDMLVKHGVRGEKHVGVIPKTSTVIIRGRDSR